MGLKNSPLHIRLVKGEDRLTDFYKGNYRFGFSLLSCLGTRRSTYTIQGTPTTNISAEKWCYVVVLLWRPAVTPNLKTRHALKDKRPGGPKSAAYWRPLCASAPVTNAEWRAATSLSAEFWTGAEIRKTRGQESRSVNGSLQHNVTISRSTLPCTLHRSHDRRP